MTQDFRSLIGEFQDAIVRDWAEEIYADARTDLPEKLSYGQLVNHLPDLLEEMAVIINEKLDDDAILDSARRLRTHAQVRFHQGALIDEVARELMIFRRVFEDFFWREGLRAVDGDLWALRDALRRTGRFVDELMAQAVLIYAASWRPPVETRSSVWPPPRRRSTDFPPAT